MKKKRMQTERGPLVLLWDKQTGRKSQMKVVILLRKPSIAPNTSESVGTWKMSSFKVRAEPSIPSYVLDNELMSI